MAGIIKNLIHGPDLYDFSCVHDRYPVCNPCHDAEVMCDKNGCRSEFFLDFPKQIQNLCLNRHIQRRCRFIRKQNFRISRQCNRQYDSLPHSAGKMVRICFFPLLRLLNPHQLHQFCHSLFHCFFSHAFLMHPYCLCNLRSDGHRRVQGRHRVLKHHRKQLSPQLPHSALPAACKIFAIDQDLSVFDLRILRQQLHNAFTKYTFSAA